MKGTRTFWGEFCSYLVEYCTFQVKMLLLLVSQQSADTIKKVCLVYYAFRLLNSLTCVKLLETNIYIN